jgi:hypothetical protein
MGSTLSSTFAAAKITESRDSFFMRLASAAAGLTPFNVFVA